MALHLSFPICAMGIKDGRATDYAFANKFQEKRTEKKGELKAVIKDEAKEQRVETKRGKPGGAWKGDCITSSGEGPVRAGLL